MANKKGEKRGRKPIPGLVRGNFLISEHLMKKLEAEAQERSMSSSMLLRLMLEERYSEKKPGGGVGLNEVMQTHTSIPLADP